MFESDVLPVVLAAGKGTRMRSKLPKVLHELLGWPLISHVLTTLRHFRFNQIITVVGYKAEDVKRHIESRDIVFVEQREQLGTGHALMCCQGFLNHFEGTVLVLNGDVPLFREESLKRLLETHIETQAAVTLVTAKVKDSQEYGVVLRDRQGRIVGIAEITDRNRMKAAEINVGIYAFKAAFLRENLKYLQRHPQKGEYYLTDLIKIAVERGELVGACEVPFEEAIGINTRKDLTLATKVLERHLVERLMLEGITIIDPESVYIEMDVEIGPDSILFPGVCLRGKVCLGEDCILEPGVIITDSEIGDKVHIKAYSVIANSKIEDGVSIGPFAHLRPGAHIGEDARIGNFVEVKKSYVGKGSKASHLTYLGDAEVGSGVNIGAGTITCNYDGRQKHKTIIGDKAFIGSNTALVAPVKVGENALIGAGSVITKDVPPNTLAIARARQVHKQKKRKA